MKKISVMVVAALLSASMFAHAANLPTKTVNVTTVKAVGKHKQDKAKSKDSGAKKEHKNKSKKQKGNTAKAQK